MNRTTARLMSLSAAFIWGTSFVVIRWGLLFLPALQFVFLRFLVAYLLMILILFWNGNIKGHLSILTSKPVIITAIFNAMGYIFQFIGQQYTSATNASLLINLSSVFVAVFAHIFLSEKLSIMGILGVISAFTGAGLLITKGSVAGIFTEHTIGDLICLLSGLSWAIYILESKKVSRKDINDLQLLSVWFLYLTLFSAPLSFLSGFKAINYEALLAVLYTSIFCTVIGFLLWYNGLKILEATTSSIYFMIEIIVSGVLEVAIFGVSLSPIEIVGGIIAIVGVIITDLSFSRRKST